MTDKRREELIRSGVPISGEANCGCVFRGSERDEQNCLEMIHVHGIDGIVNERDKLLVKIANASYEAEDAEDFIQWVQEVTEKWRT